MTDDWRARAIEQMRWAIAVALPMDVRDAYSKEAAEAAFDVLGVEQVGWEPQPGFMRKRPLYFLNGLDDPEFRALEQVEEAPQQGGIV